MLLLFKILWIAVIFFACLFWLNFKMSSLAFYDIVYELQQVVQADY